jgi:hypothetical protein
LRSSTCASHRFPDEQYRDTIAEVHPGEGWDPCRHTEDFSDDAPHHESKDPKTSRTWAPAFAGVVGHEKRNPALRFCFSWAIEKILTMEDKAPARTNRHIDEAH